MNTTTEKLLTIAIPAYNASEFLPKCLQSLVDSKQMESMEVLVVDDGSQNDPTAVVEPFIDQFPGSIRLIHKENGGHGSVINFAAKIAVGKYMKILDADDWVIADNMTELLQYLAHTISDVVITNFDMVDAEGRFRQPFEIEGVEFKRDYSMDELAALPECVYACSTFHGIFYRTEFYRRMNIRVSERVFYEDQEYATLPFYGVNNVSYLNLTIYQYLVGRPGQSVSHENQVKRLPEIKYILDNLIRFYQTHSEMSKARKKYFRYKIGVVILSYYVAALLKNPNRKQGRNDAAALRAELRQSSQELMLLTEKKYWIARCLHAIHMTPDGLERIKRTHFYYILKKFI